MAPTVSYRANSPSSAVFVFCLLVIGATLLLDFIPLEWKQFDTQRILLCALVAFLVPLHSVFAFGKAKRARSYSSLIWFLPVSLVFVGHYWFLDRSQLFPFEGMMFLLFFLVAGLNGVFIRDSVGIERAVVALVYAVVIVCAFYSAITLMTYAFILNDGISPRSLIPWGFVNIRFWSHLATWFLPLFPVALWVGPFRHSSLWRFAVGFTAAIWWWVVIMSAAHGTVVALMISTVVVMTFYRRDAWRWFRAFSLYLMVGVLVWLVLSVIIPGAVSQGAKVSLSDIGTTAPIRIIQWTEALAMSLVNFPFGMGGQSWLTHAPLTRPYIEGSVVLYGAPHNMYMLWAAEYGWVCIAALLFPMGYAVHRLAKLRSQTASGASKSSHAAIGVVASVIAALMHSGVSSVLLTPPAMLAGLLVLSVFWGIVVPGSFVNQSSPIEPTRRERAGNYGNPSIRALWGVIFALSLWFGMTFFGEVMSYHRSMQADWECFRKETRLSWIPRFWQHGFYPNQLDGYRECQD